jgi:hypothetical protein
MFNLTFALAREGNLNLPAVSDFDWPRADFPPRRVSGINRRGERQP